MNIEEITEYWEDFQSELKVAKRTFETATLDSYYNDIMDIASHFDRQDRLKDATVVDEFAQALSDIIAIVEFGEEMDDLSRAINNAEHKFEGIKNQLEDKPTKSHIYAAFNKGFLTGVKMSDWNLTISNDGLPTWAYYSPEIRITITVLNISDTNNKGSASWITSAILEFADGFIHKIRVEGNKDNFDTKLSMEELYDAIHVNASNEFRGMLTGWMDSLEKALDGAKVS